MSIEQRTIDMEHVHTSIVVENFKVDGFMCVKLSVNFVAAKFIKEKVEGGRAFGMPQSKQDTLSLTTHKIGKWNCIVGRLGFNAIILNLLMSCDTETNTHTVWECFVERSME